MMNLHLITLAALLAGLMLAQHATADPQTLGSEDLDPVSVHDSPEHQPVPMVVEGQPRAVVVVVQPGRMTGQLVRELVDSIEATTGAKLDVVREMPAADQPAIVIGECEASRAAGIDASKLPPEGFVVKTAPNRIFLVGETNVAQDSANAWAVADLLERWVGVRWWWPLDHHGRTVEKTDTLVMRPVHYSDAPAFRMRHGWPPFYNGTPHGTLRVSNLYDRLRGGNSWPNKLVVHAPHPHQWNPIYKETRPEIYALRADGSRNFSMYDYTEPRLMETFLENIELYVNATDEQRKTKEFKNRTAFIRDNSITVSPPDLGVHSASERAQELLEPEKGRYASASKLMGLFVKQLAEKVAERWPDINIVYLPYVNYTLAPEGIEFPDNVEVQLCGMPGVAMYKEPALREQFQANIDRWAELTGGQVQTWDYSCWPTDRTKAPFQYPNIVKDYYSRNRGKIIGTFINGGIPDEWLAQHITMYVWMKVLWDPDINVHAVLDEFCDRMFGPAASPIRQLLQLQVARWENVEWPIDRLSPKALYEMSYTKEVMDRMAELLDEAKRKAAGDEVYAARVAYYAQAFPAFFAEAESLRSGKGIRHINAQKVPDNPVIDGKLDDRWWEMAEPLVGFERNGGKEAEYNTEVRIVWTLDGVTVGMKMYEPAVEDLKMDIKTRDDGALWPANDNAEIFLDVTGQKQGRYVQWLITPANTVMDLLDGDQTWNPEDVRHATHIGDDYWSVELYLPLSLIGEIEGFQKPATGSQWAAQFTRHRIADGRDSRNDKSRPEYSRMNNKLGGFSKNAADFGLIKFVE